MVPKNRISGSAHISMSVIGRIIRRMGLGFSIMRMGINMREVGMIVRDMGKVPSGFVILKVNLEDSILVIGRMIRRRVEVRCFLNPVIVMMVCGWIANPMDKEE